jgi:hypothetical protein
MNFTSPPGPQNFDLVIIQNADDTFSICEIRDGKLERLDGSFDRTTVEERAISGAEDSGSDVWIQEHPDFFRLLSD